MNPPDYHSNLPVESKEDRELLNARGLLQNFFEGVALAVRAHGFEAVRSDLVAGLYSNVGAKAKLSDVQTDARIYGLTAVFGSERFYLVFRKFHPSTEEAAQNMTRAGGDVRCELCNFTLREHPTDERFHFLHVRCDGRRVKL
jgi:hypothetical protein